MFRRPIHDEVMGLASRLADKCHPQVVQKHADELARYARLTSACDALESFLGCRPRMDDDAFDVLSARRSQVADLIAERLRDGRYGGRLPGYRALGRGDDALHARQVLHF